MRPDAMVLKGLSFTVGAVLAAMGWCSQINQHGFGTSGAGQTVAMVGKSGAGKTLGMRWTENAWNTKEIQFSHRCQNSGC